MLLPLVPAIVFFSAFALSASLSGAERPPNFIVVLIDDLGATDLGCFGSKFYQTPNIDRLAQDGMKFTQAYSACTVCSPTRAALMAGRYPAALRVTDWIPGHQRPAAKLRVPDWTMRLPQDVPNLPRALKAAGYVSASIGKWHLGEEGPERYGFDVEIGNNGRGSPVSYTSPYKNPKLPDGRRASS